MGCNGGTTIGGEWQIGLLLGGRSARMIFEIVTD